MKWNVQPIDLGLELRERIELRLGRAPLVLARPEASELLHRRQLDPLRSIRDELLAGPPCRLDAATQFVECFLRDVDSERTNLRVVDDGDLVRGGLLRHRSLLPSQPSFLNAILTSSESA
jgi:hypothetical protein